MKQRTLISNVLKCTPTNPLIKSNLPKLIILVLTVKYSAKTKVCSRTNGKRFICCPTEWVTARCTRLFKEWKRSSNRTQCWAVPSLPFAMVMHFVILHALKTTSIASDRFVCTFGDRLNFSTLTPKMWFNASRHCSFHQFITFAKYFNGNFSRNRSPITKETRQKA